VTVDRAGGRLGRSVVCGPVRASPWGCRACRGRGTVRVVLAQEDATSLRRTRWAPMMLRAARPPQPQRCVVAPTGLVRVVVGVQDRGGPGAQGHLVDFLDTGPADLDALAESRTAVPGMIGQPTATRGVLLDEHVRSVGCGRGPVVVQGVDGDARTDGAVAAARYCVVAIRSTFGSRRPAREVDQPATSARLKSCRRGRADIPQRLLFRGWFDGKQAPPPVRSVLSLPGCRWPRPATSFPQCRWRERCAACPGGRGWALPRLARARLRGRRSSPGC
jgi:hypothetical protein